MRKTMNPKDFAKECVAFGEAFKLYEKTVEVYHFLLLHSEEKFTPTEIAEGTGHTYTFYNGYTYIQYHAVVNPLYWLYRMGLIDREEYTYEVEIVTSRQLRPDRKVINGTTYIGYVPCEETYTKTVTAYRWFAK
jgi:hypothetical protein